MGPFPAEFTVIGNIHAQELVPQAGQVEIQIPRHFNIFSKTS